MCCFWTQYGPLAPIFFVKNYYHSHLPISSFHCAKSRVMRMCNFWAQNDPKPLNAPCFFHSCLSTCQKLKSDINLLVKY